LKGRCNTQKYQDKEDKSDDFAHSYIEYGVASEGIELMKAKVSEYQLHDQNIKIKNWADFLKDYPDLQNKTYKEIVDVSVKYTFKNILRFLNKEIQTGDIKMSSFLGKLIIDYSKLSSFVHGGIRSYQEMSSMSNSELRNNEYIRICELTFQISNSIKLFALLMLVQTDKETFAKHYLKLDGLLKRINIISSASA